MKLTKEDVDLIEGLVFQGADDLAVSIARSIERLESRIDHMETRLYRRIGELEQQITKNHRAQD